MGTLRQEVKRLAQVERDKNAAHARIAELEAESEALHRANIQLAKSCQKAHEALADSRDTAWNDAIEAAADESSKADSLELALHGEGKIVDRIRALLR